mgnify:CR=1 FL=1
MQKQSGVTLMEVMITVAIVSILVGIAVPSYISYITESHRKEAKSAVLELGQFMERYYTAHDRYNNDDNSTLTADDLPFQVIPKEGGNIYYNVLVNSTASTYTLALVPTGSMDGDACGNYTLDQTGVHEPTTRECW